MNKLMLPLLILFVMLVAALLQASRRAQNQPRPGTFRPKAKGARQHGLDPSLPQVMSRSQLNGLRDAYTSASLDAQQPLRCCCGCQALYQASSVAALHADNAGRCAVCGGTAFADVRLAD
jgi:hypothetical protein